MSGINRISGSSVDLNSLDTQQNKAEQKSQNQDAVKVDTTLSIPQAGRADQTAIKDGVAVDKNQWQTYKSSDTSKGITHFEKSESWTKSKDLAGTVGAKDFPSSPYGNGGGLTITSRQPNVALAGLDISKEVGGGVLYAQGKAIAGESHNVTANVDLKNYGAVLGAEAKAGIDVAGQAGYEREIGQVLGQNVGVDVRANVNGFAGAEGAASAEISFKGGPKVSVGGEAFAGARAKLEGTAGLQVNGSEVGNVHAGAEGWAGVGAEGHFNVGLKDGKLTFDVGAGVALGLGGEVDFGGSINLSGAVRAFQNSPAGHAITTVAADAEKVAVAVEHKMADAGHNVVNWVKHIF